MVPWLPDELWPTLWGVAPTMRSLLCPHGTLDPTKVPADLFLAPEGLDSCLASNWPGTATAVEGKRRVMLGAFCLENYQVERSVMLWVHSDDVLQEAADHIAARPPWRPGPGRSSLQPGGSSRPCEGWLPVWRWRSAGRHHGPGPWLLGWPRNMDEILGDI